MGLTEKKSNPDILAQINGELGKKYQEKTFGNRVCFVNKNAVPFNVFTLKGEEGSAFGVEYADSVEAVVLGVFEDGDTFYLENYGSLDDMIVAMCQEIDNA